MGSWLSNVTGGLSLKNLAGEIGDTLNPFDGDTNHDVFTQMGDQMNYSEGTPSSNTASASSTPYIGSMYYDTTTNSIKEYTQDENGNDIWVDNTSPYWTGPTAPETPNPYAQWGSQANYDNLVNNFNTGAGNIRTGVGEAGTSYLNQSKVPVYSFLNETKNAYGDLDTNRIRNNLNKIRTSQGIMDMIGTGIRSGLTRLGNKNSGDSSAAQVMAGAVADYGNKEQQSANNEFELKNEDLNTAETRLKEKTKLKQQELTTGWQGKIDELISGAQNAFAALNDEAANADLPTRIEIENEKQQLKTNLTNQLKALDDIMAGGGEGYTGVNDLKAQTPEYIMGEANRQNLAGATAPGFNYSSEIPTYVANSGGNTANLPLYSTRRLKREV